MILSAIWWALNPSISRAYSCSPDFLKKASGVPKRMKFWFGVRESVSHSDTAAPNPPISECSSMVTTSLKRSNAPSRKASSSGFTVWKLTTCAEIPCSPSLWAASMTSGSMFPVDSRQTSLPSDTVMALPIWKFSILPACTTGSPLFPHANIDWTVLLHRGAQRRANLEGISGTDHHHVRYRPQKRDVLAGMVGRTEPGVGQAGADRDDR